MMQLALPADDATPALNSELLSFAGLPSHGTPTSAIDAMARNEILQIVVFSLFFGTAMAALGDHSRVLVEALDCLALIMLKVTDYVMRLVPLAVFGAVAGAPRWW